MMNKRRTRGRPAGPTHTRDDILDVARRRFLADGYDRVTMRSIAAEAGVDAALISYHFGSKKGLFSAAMQLPVSPADVLAAALEGPLEQIPDRMLRTVLAAWDAPDRAGTLRAFAGAAVSDPDVARLFREMAEREMISRIAERLGGADARRRAAIAASQVAGMIFVRYVLAIEPLASMPPGEVARRMAPALRAALAGPPVRSSAGTSGTRGSPARP